MTTFSKAALVAALLTGASMTFSPPVLAAGKQDKNAQAPAQAQLKLSDDFRKVAGPAQTALNSGDLATAGPGITAAEAAAKTDDERYVAAQLRLSLVAKQQQAAGSTPQSDATLAAPLDVLLNNPSTPQDQIGKYANARGSIAFEQRKYADALRYYAKAQAAGYQDPNMPLQIAKAKVESGDIAGGVAQIDTVVKADEASGQKAPEDLYRYAIAKLYKTPDRAALLDWVKRWLTAYPSPKNWRDAIVAFGFQGPTAAQMGKPEKMDLYRLMGATGSLADQADYLQYAQYANDLGLPDEAKTVLAKGKAAGKLPASDATVTALLKKANGGIASEGSLTALSSKAAASPKGELASQTGDAYLGQGNYPKAIEMYKLALQKGVTNTDIVNLHLGIAEALSGDKASATTQFAAIQTAPTKDVATLWQTWAGAGASATATAGPAATPQS